MVPLAERLRPKNFDQIKGQDHLVGPTGLLTKLIEANHPTSILLHGPAGSGKTTIARLFAKAFERGFHPFSAAEGTAADIKKFLKEAVFQPILFVDEIHRFNKSQQDLFLPYIEDGTIILIGATTENPAYALNDALLSRLRVCTLNPLTPTALSQIIAASTLEIEDNAREKLIKLSNGDARYLLGSIEQLQMLHKETITTTLLEETLHKRLPTYDKHGDAHYDYASRLQKAIRASNLKASLEAFQHMLNAGEDPRFIARRLLVIASEDIGLADPDALPRTLAAWEAYEKLGSPEGHYALTQIVVYLALAPKSRSIADTLKTGKYTPGSMGFEKEMKRRLDYWSK
ncbi:MAG: Replication-associated recombination protein A [Chlamydiia bacterium]|nr:Replication-associated recombination protein A [Chlamydiia bacterium]MCH9615764.1 Replication-associated recombination protein A [Chlamydiia bacterium]MCH9628833.1 Replication-associated recombination protein A [Chlamydiia bacterium]